MKDAPHGTIEQVDINEVCAKLGLPQYNGPIRQKIVETIRQIAQSYFVGIYPLRWKHGANGKEEVTGFLIYRDHFLFKWTPAPGVFEKLAVILWKYGFEGGPDKLRVGLESNRYFEYTFRNLEWITEQVRRDIEVLFEKCRSEIDTSSRIENPVLITDRRFQYQQRKFHV